MPRKRNKENQGFPSRWQLYHGAIYYQVPAGLEKYWDGKKKFRLGSTASEAYREWAKRVGKLDKIVTIGDLLERYIQEVTRKRTSDDSVKGDMRAYKVLNVAFHDVRLEDITPQDIYKYVDKRSAKIAARREKALLSHAFTKAVEWGYIKQHPFKGEVRLEGETPRSRYVEDWEIEAIQNMKPRRKGDIVEVIKTYIDFKILSGMRQGNILALTMSNFKSDGIHFTPIKRGKPTVMEWTDELQAAFDKAKAVRPVLSSYLFCTRRGKKYSGNGWRAIWQRFMKRVLAETDVKERFTEHDIRGKSGSDAPDRKRASELLTHADEAITARSYRRKPERIKPLR